MMASLGEFFMVVVVIANNAKQPPEVQATGALLTEIKRARNIWDNIAKKQAL